MKNGAQGSFGADLDSVSGLSDLQAAAGAGGTTATGRSRGHILLAADVVALAASVSIVFALGGIAGEWDGLAADPRPLLMAALTLALLAAAGLYRRDLPDVQEVRGLVLAVAGVALIDAALRLAPWLPSAPTWQLAVWPLFAGAVLVARALMRGASAIHAPRPVRDQGALQRLGLRAGFAAKRILDILVAGSLLLLLSPFFLIAIVLIRLDGGPALFGQMRVGRDGRRFRCLKFRSMCIDAQARLAAILDSDPDARAEWETHQKLRHDPRVTRIGRFLRETSLDELPQLLNVLRGEMSLVGPRPIMAPEVPGYEGDQAYFHGPSFPLYAACTPGITGLWQVSGRADTTHDERIRLDAWYARNWSFWLDLVILLRTVRVILNRSGC